MGRKGLLSGSFWLSFTAVFVALAGLGFAAQLEQRADPLNYYTPTMHNITMNYTGTTVGARINATYPGGFTFLSASANCTHDASAKNVSCSNIQPNTTAWYSVNSTGPSAEFAVSVFSAVVTNTSFRADDIKIVNISDLNIADTLIELGRGRGDYIYSTRYGGSKQENGTTYFPANSKTQLWYLHRIYNIGQYLGLQQEGQNITLNCTYPGLPVVSKHPQASRIANESGNWTVNYTFDGTVEGSFWKMAWTSIETQRNSQQSLADGANITANCSATTYDFSTGKVRTNGELVLLTAATTTPVAVNASPQNSTLARGQSENPITYTVTNNGRYKIRDLQLEFEAPQYSKWISVRGELFGTSIQKYNLELPELSAGESAVVQLVARFDIPATATDAAAIKLGKWDAAFIPPWEMASYNPLKIEQKDNDIVQVATINLNNTSSVYSVKGSTDTIVTELGKTRAFLDELAFLVTDSVGGGTTVEATSPGGQVQQISGTSSGNQQSSIGYSGGSTFQVTQIISNNAWLVILLGAIIVAGYLIIGKDSSSRRNSAQVIYKPLMHG